MFECIHSSEHYISICMNMKQINHECYMRNNEAFFNTDRFDQWKTSWYTDTRLHYETTKKY
jgi:hypothetical protein